MSIYHTYTWINIYSARRRRRGERWRGSRRTWRTWRRAWRRCGTVRPRRKSTRCGGSEDTVLVQHTCALNGGAAFKARSGMQRKSCIPDQCSHMCMWLSPISTEGHDVSHIKTGIWQQRCRTPARRRQASRSLHPTARAGAGGRAATRWTLRGGPLRLDRGQTATSYMIG